MQQTLQVLEPITYRYGVKKTVIPKGIYRTKWTSNGNNLTLVGINPRGQYLWTEDVGEIISPASKIHTILAAVKLIPGWVRARKCRWS